MADLRLSLEHMTVLGLGPVDIISAAEALYVPLISLILDTGGYPLPVQSFLQSPTLVKETRRKLADSDVAIHGAEGFLLDERVDRDRTARMIDIAASLGVERAIAMATDPDPARLIDSFADLCEMTAMAGIQASMEFVAFTPLARLADALDLVKNVGAKNAAISVDILHLMRSGGAPADIADVRGFLGAAQLCDGPKSMPTDKWANEGMHGRLAPGEGEFPIAAFLDALPPGLVVGVEVPKGLIDPGPEMMASARASIAAARRSSHRLA